MRKYSEAYVVGLRNEMQDLKRHIESLEGRIERLDWALEFAVTLIPKEIIPTGCGNNTVPWLVNQGVKMKAEQPYGWRKDKPTYKQLNYIKELEYEYGEPFTGTTKGEASDYINKWAKVDQERRESESFYNPHEDAGDRI